MVCTTVVVAAMMALLSSRCFATAASSSDRTHSARAAAEPAAVQQPTAAEPAVVARVTDTTALPGRNMQFVRDTIGGLASTNAVTLAPREPELPAAAAAAPATLLVIQADDYDWKAIFAGARSGLAVYSTGIVVMHWWSNATTVQMPTYALRDGDIPGSCHAMPDSTHASPTLVATGASTSPPPIASATPRGRG